ncbi:MAG: S8 family serine peptidase [Chloroflexia bacterium]
MSKPDLTAFPGRYTGALPGRPRPGGSGPGRDASADGLRTSEWHLDRIGQPLAPAVEANAPIVAVIDTGMDYNHPDLAQAYQRCPVVPGLYCDLIGYDQDPMDGNLHGTHVAGTIGARADGQGVTGVSPNSKILPVRIFDDTGYTDLMTIFQALDYTALAKLRLPNLKVANMSWGGYVLANSREHQEFNARLRAMRSAGILPVAAAGNESDFFLQAYPLILGREIATVPAMSGSTLAVAATDQNDYRTFFSNYSTPINVNKCQNRTRYGECLARNEYTRKWYTFAPIAAPGWNVLSTGTEGQILQLSGTSMASPIVAGAAARVMARYPGMSVDQVAIRLRDTGQPLGKAQGFPLPTRRLDLRRALGVGGTGITGRVVDGVSGKPWRAFKSRLATVHAPSAQPRTHPASTP